MALSSASRAFLHLGVAALASHVFLACGSSGDDRTDQSSPSGTAANAGSGGSSSNVAGSSATAGGGALGGAGGTEAMQGGNAGANGGSRDATGGADAGAGAAQGGSGATGGDASGATGGAQGGSMGSGASGGASAAGMGGVSAAGIGGLSATGGGGSSMGGSAASGTGGMGGNDVAPACDPCPFGQVPDPSTGACAAICPNGQGLLAGAAWPMHGGCPTMRGVSPFSGPMNPQIAWQTNVPKGSTGQREFIVGVHETVYLPNQESGLVAMTLFGASSLFPDIDGDTIPALAADGTIYAGNSMAALLAYTPAGLPLWSDSDGGGAAALTVGPDGAIYSAPGSLYATNPDGSMKWKAASGSNFGWDTIVALAPDGTSFTVGDKLYAVDPTGKVKWSAASAVSGTYPAVSTSGDVFFGNDTHLVGAHADGTMIFDLTLGPARVSWVSISPDSTLWVSSDYGGAELWHVSATGTLLKTLHFEGMTMTAPVIDACGNVYVSDGVLNAISPNGDITSSFADPDASGNEGDGCGQPVLVANGSLAVWCGDHLYVLND